MSSAETEVPESPSSLHAARFANTAYFFAACVFVLFPTVVGAGTASPTERYVVGGLVAVCALLGSLLRRRGRLALVGPGLLMLGGWPLGALWLSVFGALSVAYVAWGLARDASAPSADTDEEPEGHAVRDNVEAIAMALVIALLFKTFIAEAFVIPTGSMEPTIFGSQRGKRAGDRILAVKPPLLFGDPPRWSIIVFRFPLFRPTNYIKRLVGLPGERLEIRDGDVYADGELLSKPDAVQETLWQPLFPDVDARPELAADLSRYWRVEGDGSIEGDRIRFDGKTEIVWDQQLRQSDFKLEADFEFESSPSGHDAAVTFRIDGQKAGNAVLRPTVTFSGYGTELHGLTQPHEWSDTLTSTRLGISIADRVARIYVGGRQVGRVDFSGDTLEAVPDDQRISIEIDAGGGEVTNLTLAHDIHYTGRHAFDIPDDGFVMLGDNTSNSSDSRKWAANVVTLNDGSGIQYVAPDRVHTESDGDVANFVTDREAGVFRFRDSYGVPREVPMDQADVELRKLPFARRHDLVGRAFFIFFPFPPFQDEFRPRFLP